MIEILGVFGVIVGVMATLSLVPVACFTPAALIGFFFIAVGVNCKEDAVVLAVSAVLVATAAAFAILCYRIEGLADYKAVAAIPYAMMFLLIPSKDSVGIGGVTASE